MEGLCAEITPEEVKAIWEIGEGGKGEKKGKKKKRVERKEEEEEEGMDGAGEDDLPPKKKYNRKKTTGVASKTAQGILIGTLWP